jgi:hypothetical protein
MYNRRFEEPWGCKGGKLTVDLPGGLIIVRHNPFPERE